MSSNLAETGAFTNNPSNDTTNAETILSISYDKGRISCSYYKFESMELYVSYEAHDPMPFLSYLQNLFRKIKPNFVLASGPDQLYKKILKLLDYPGDFDPYLFRTSNKKKASALNYSNFLIYQYNLKNLHKNRQKILSINLPGMEKNWSQTERSIFLNSILPLNQDLVIQTLGNLCNYLDTNWRHIYIRQNDNQHMNNINSSNNNNLIITDLKVFYLESQVLIDESILKSLQIFADIHHPSDYKKDIIKEGYSVYNLLNRCTSKMGKNMLKNLLAQPIRDRNELELRYSTIKWFIDQKTNKNNIQNFEKFQKYLRNINDISICFKNIQLKPNCVKHWKMFKETIYGAYIIMNLCIECAPNIIEKNTLINIIADNGKTDFNILGNTLLTIDKIIDLEESEIQNNFIVKHSLDSLLDENREKMLKIQDSLSEAILYEGYHLPECVTNIEGYYIPEIGYVIKVKTIDNNQPLALIENNNTMNFLVQSYDDYYFKTTLCDELNQLYGNIYFDIRDHEKIICNRLLEYLNQTLPILQKIIKLCGKLDYLMAFSTISIEKKLIKPILTIDKCIEIKNGRHILCEQIYNYIPIDTNISIDNKNIITILTAANESGKSCYMKQIGLIMYLAHIGCYVPATYAKLFLLDSIYSRLHSPESTYYNCSTFLTDLQQMSRIISYSTDKSLLLIDEFGTGTQVIEGKSLLVSCIENLSSKLLNCPIALISTHYSDIYEFIKFGIDVNIEWKTFITKKAVDGSLISTYRLKKGLNSNLKYAYEITGVKSFFDKTFNKNTNIQQSVLRKTAVEQIHSLKSDLAFGIIQRFIAEDEFIFIELLKQFHEYVYIFE